MKSTHPPKGKPTRRHRSAELQKTLAHIGIGHQQADLRVGTRLRNYFLTGLVVVGPVTITLYIAWWFINVIDAWVKPFLPRVYNPDTYLPFTVPGIGLLFAIIMLTVIGALAANLLGRTIISSGEIFLDRMPIVSNLYQALKQIFVSVVSAAGPGTAFQKVGLIEFPSKGIWSLVYVTGEAAGEIKDVQPGGESDLLTVFMPTGIVPPTGFVCLVPRKAVIFLRMSVEDAAKMVISAGMVMPEYQQHLQSLAEQVRAEQAASDEQPSRSA